MALTMVLIIPPLAACQSEPKVDPDTGRIRLLVIGEVTSGGNVYVMSLIKSDPRISLYATIMSGASAGPDESRRLARIHAPRSKQRFGSSIDVANFLDSAPWAFTNGQQQWIHDAIEQEGLGLLLVQLGYHSCHYSPLHCNRPDVWMSSPIYQAFPMDLVLEKLIRGSPYMEILERTAVVDLPNMENQPYGPPAGLAASIEGTNTGLVVARPGSKLHSRWKVGKEDAIVSWEYGRGVALALPMGWDHLRDEFMREYKYFVDFVLNSIYYAANVPVPDDPELAHSLRAAFTQFGEQRTLMFSLFDFIDKFGANTAPLHGMLDDLEGKSTEASQFYMSGDYQGSWDVIEEALEGLKDVSDESAKLRKRALFWVYVTEWLTVTATSMMCGFILWTVMVKRRYYSEVATTRLERSVQE
jgi:hypothetical protein